MEKDEQPYSKCDAHANIYPERKRRREIDRKIEGKNKRYDNKARLNR